ncbi:hypothetical protein GQX74_012762 [Glossina fuscipes]|nr:hypothetical protein GQX74_012762 [Glossina fuscipes]
MQCSTAFRYGLPDKPLELGRVTPGTYCTRQFDECYRNKCRLQSPNYPGMYPRNVTCYWTIRQKEVPTSKHAMIAVSQENQHKALVKRSIASFNKTSRSIRAWSDCTGERDHLIFYDGSSTNDPVLAKYCGGDWLPRVVSRLNFSNQDHKHLEIEHDILMSELGTSNLLTRLLQHVQHLHSAAPSALKPGAEWHGPHNVSDA